MNTRTVITVILKILGIYIFLQFLNILPMVISMAQVNVDMMMGQSNPMASRMGISTPMGLYIGVMSLLYLASAWALIFRARNLADFFAGGLPDEGNLSGVGTDRSLTLAFQCIGLYAVVIWLPQFIQTFCRTIMYGAWSDPQTPFAMRFYQNWSVLIGPLVGTLIGLLLIFKLNGLLRLMKMAKPMTPEREETSK